MSKPEVIVIAIDGPSASGKSTVARHVAGELGFVYVDSGSLYRGITWKAVREHVDVTDAGAMGDLVRAMHIAFRVEWDAVRFRIDGTDPGDEVRSEHVVECVSDVAAIAEVRSFVVAKLREMTCFGAIVMEGRDIGSVVFPQTPYKFYLDADPVERARRRHREIVEEKAGDTVDRVFESLERRDRKDTTRKTAPLQIAPGADVIDTTGMPIDEVVAYIMRELRSLGCAP